VQTFIAAGLLQRGFKIELCFDDLGNAAGFESLDAGLKALKTSIEQWAAKSSSTYVDGSLTANAKLFSEYVGSEPARKPMQGALESLGGNLVKWLLKETQLKKVLKDSKLMNSDDQAALDKRPRKLLTPAVVWTVLELITKNDLECKGVLTLGGEDEKAIWEISPVKTVPIHNIFIPKVQGDMDTDILKPKSQRDIQDALNINNDMKTWFIRYGWHLPALLSGSSNTSIETKLSASTFNAAQAIEEFIL
jgi:hypothetical protein